MNISVKTNLSDIFRNGVSRQIDQALQATHFLVEGEYKKQSPVDSGDFRREVKTVKRRSGEYTVTTDAETEDGKPYPVFVQGGTGVMRGVMDFGYTTGHVRAGTVERGIGGIRPNMVAKRAAEDAEPLVVRFFKKEMKKLK